MSAQISGTGTILIADDDPALRKMVTLILREHGYDVLAAADGNEALKVARKQEGRIDLLITDVKMPHLDGFDLRERFLRERPGVPILVVSGELDAEIMGDDFEVLRKPFRPEELVTRVAGMLHKPVGADNAF